MEIVEDEKYDDEQHVELSPFGFKINNYSPLYKPPPKGEDSPKQPSPLQIDVVLYNVFKFLPTKDLKSCRLVCKNWRCASQGIFRKRVAVVFQNTESPLHIRFFGKGLKPSTTNFMHTFQEEEFPCDSYYFYYEAWNWADQTNCRFITHYGETIRTFKADVREYSNTISVEEIYSFRNKLLMYMPNIEHLSLKISLSELHPRSATFVFTNLDGENADPYAHVQLLYLKSISFRIGTEGSQPLTDQQKQVAIVVFFDIIKRAKKLESLEINSCPAMVEIVQYIPRETLKFLRHLGIDDWRCQSEDALNMFELLTQLTTENSLGITSFASQFDFDKCDDNDVKINLNTLFNFLGLRKNSLLTLSIELPTFVTNGGRHLAHILDGNRTLIPFPKMFKLSTLKLYHSQRILLQLFIECDNWSILFPQLKIFDYQLKSDVEVEELSLYQSFSEIRSDSVTHITVTMTEVPVIANGSIIVNWKDYLELYELVKSAFPVLKTFKINCCNENDIHIYSNHDLFEMDNLRLHVFSEAPDDEDEQAEGDPNRRCQEFDYFDSQYTTDTESNKLEESIDDLDNMRLDDFDDDDDDHEADDEYDGDDD